MTRYVQPHWLFGETTRADWRSLNKGVEAPTSGDDLSPAQLFRWALNKDLGLPREPFVMWTRKAQLGGTSVPLPGGALTVTPAIPRDIMLPARAMRVSLVIDTPSGSLTLDAFDTGGTRIAGLTIDPGASGQTVVLTGTGIARVRGSGSGRIDAVTYLSASAYANLPDWTQIEIVGLPVDTSAGGLPYSTADQGMTTALMSPADAALQRLNRAAPRLGWPPPAGFGGPAWAPPDNIALIETYQRTLIPELMSMLSAVSDPIRQADFRTDQALPQPQDQLGGAAHSAALGQSKASVPPLGLLAMACHGDMYAALSLGFATGYPSGQPAPTDVSPAIDYMVTVEHKFTYRVGSLLHLFAGELAAFFAPAGAQRPQPPAGLTAAAADGGVRPAGRDKPRVCSVSVSWNRTDTMAGSMQAVSSVIARALPSGTPSLLVNTRPTDAAVPFVAATPENATSAQAARATFVNGVFPDLSEPAGTYTYLVCGQNRWGLWSNWGEVPLEPAPDVPQQPVLVGATLDLADPTQTGTSRSGLLKLDVSWDWHDRSPAAIEVAAVYVDAAATPPPTPPAEVFDPTASAAPLVLTWPTDVSTGLVVEPPSPSLAGMSVTRSEPELVSGDTTPPDEVGRYRVSVPVTLDFSSGSDLKLAAWIRGIEKFSGLTSDWTLPRTATTHNPVPPLPPGPPGPLVWSSLADATGRARAHLTWAATPGAESYVVYHADETALLSASGHPAPNLDIPLSDRKTAVDAAVRIESVRDAFTRVSPDPVTDTWYDMELPRGSQVLHGFVVLARSGTGVESGWPTTPPIEAGGRGYTLMGIPRPRVPVPPVLSVTATSATTVSVRVSASAEQVGRIDIYRTSVARLSGDIGTMGPPVTSLFPAGNTWPDYTDAVTPSWRPYWYRAVAWGRTDDDNGWRTSPGPAAAVKPMLLPPATVPGVTEGSIVPASGTTPSYLTFRTDVPPIRTSLGLFTLRVVATWTDTSGPAQAVLNTTLDAIPGSSSVPDAGTDVIGPAWLAPDGSIGVMLTWPPGSTPVSARVTVTDPRGRSAADPTEVLP